MPALPALLLRTAPRPAAEGAGTAWLSACRALALRAGQRWRAAAPALRFAAFRAAIRQPWREAALERALEGMAGRVAQAELALLREQRRSRQHAARADRAEADLVRLQDMLDRLRREQRGAPAA